MTTAKTGSWPRLLMLLGLLFAGVTGWSIYRAASDVSAVSDADYYSHGLRYNHTRVEQQAAESLGWHLETSLEERQLRIALRDRIRQPVTGAGGDLTLYAVRAAGPTRLPLVELAPGLYSTRLPRDLGGEVIARLTLVREGARISRTLMFNL